MLKNLIGFLVILLVAIALARAVASHRGWLRVECAAAVKLREVVPVARVNADGIDDVVDWLRKTTGARIVFTNAALYDAQAHHPIELRLTNVTIAQVLDRALMARPDAVLTYVAQGNEIVIAVPSELPQAMTARSYDIRDLLPSDDDPMKPPPPPPVAAAPNGPGATGGGLFGGSSVRRSRSSGGLFSRSSRWSTTAPPPTTLPSPRQEACSDMAEAVERAVSHDSWGTAAPASSVQASIVPFGGRLIVTQTRAAQWEVEQFLESLRMAWGPEEFNTGGCR